MRAINLYRRPWLAWLSTGSPRCGLAAALILACLAGRPVGPVSAAPSGAGQTVDVALVLAVDVSYSMDPGELALQRNGYVAALRSPEVMQAIRSGFLGRVAITYVEWAGPGTQTVIVPWTLVESPRTADRLADQIVPQSVVGRYGTSISSALSFAAGLLEENEFQAQRRVIDVSGDGPNNIGPPVEPARDQVVRQGIVINGLPLVLDRNRVDRYSIPDLDRYYATCVIGGAGSFMIPVTTIEGFEEAVRRKLVQEIASRKPVARLIQAADRQGADPQHGSDCLIGERLRGQQPWRR